MHIVRRLTILLLFALALNGLPAPGSAQVAVSITVAPPLLPIYAQPVIPAPGYIWTPGYWAWGPYGYYWVPGTWVLPPAVGLLWTPGYWGWSGGFFLWHVGYWGPHVGFYGGVNYGFGYVGVGYLGGFWDHGAFRYNTAVNNLRGARIANVYNQRVVVSGPATHVSYNGGRGGLTAQPNAAQLAAAHELHGLPTALQQQHENAASANRALLATVNHGRPAVAATPRAGVFNGPGMVGTRGAGPRPNAGAQPAMRPTGAPNVRPNPGAQGVAHPAGAPNPHAPNANPHPQGGHGNQGERHEEQH